MEEFQGMEELDLTEVEREICRLPDVAISRLVAEPSGRVSEVHVVAHAGKHPKQIARDVQSIALASFGLELDRRIISVVQLGGDVLDSQMLAGYLRPSVVAITAEANGLRSLVRVTLGREDEEAVGFAEGSIATTRGTGSSRSRPSTRCASSSRPPSASTSTVRRYSRVDAHDIAVVDGGLRDAAVGAAGIGLGDRSPAARGRRGGARRARRDQPSDRVHQRRLSAAITRPSPAWHGSRRPRSGPLVRPHRLEQALYPTADRDALRRQPNPRTAPIKVEVLLSTSPSHSARSDHRDAVDTETDNDQATSDTRMASHR